MKKAIKNGQRVFALLVILFGLSVNSFSNPVLPDCDCDEPSVSLTLQTSTSASFSWDSVEGATNYKAWYYRRDDSYTSQVVFTGSTSISFTNLTAGTYVFYFATICGSEVSEIIITDDLLMGS